MSAAETVGVITTTTMGDSFTVSSMQISSAPSPALASPKPVLQSMSFTYASTTDGTTTAYKPTVSGSPPQPYHPGLADGLTGSSINSNVGPGDQMKRKRGRPRKYSPDGSVATTLVPVTLAPPQPLHVSISPSGANFSPSVAPHSAAAPPPSGTPASPPSSTKKARGRPPGSSKKQQEVEALGNANIAMSIHMIYLWINTRETTT